MDTKQVDEFKIREKKHIAIQDLHLNTCCYQVQVITIYVFNFDMEFSCMRWDSTKLKQIEKLQTVRIDKLTACKTIYSYLLNNNIF